MAPQIRLGIHGAGGNTRNHHNPGLREQENVQIVAVCNRSPESSQQVCDQMDIARACDRPEQIIDDPDIDAVVIGTWPHKHCQFTVRSLEADKHVTCEARMWPIGPAGQPLAQPWTRRLGIRTTHHR
jgi:predicted dehydrogenase